MVAYGIKKITDDYKGKKPKCVGFAKHGDEQTEAISMGYEQERCGVTSSTRQRKNYIHQRKQKKRTISPDHLNYFL